MSARSAKRACHRCIAGSPSRRPGNFLLRGQKKVTKEEALNPHTSGLMGLAMDGAHTRAAALSLLSLSPPSPIATASRLTRGCTPCSRVGNPMQRRSGGAVEPDCSCRRPSDAVLADEPGVQPALRGVKVRSLVLATGTAARAQRVASALSDASRFRALLPAASGWLAVHRLFFGDFLLAPQKKVTRPPGRTPGNRTHA